MPWSIAGTTKERDEGNDRRYAVHAATTASGSAFQSATTNTRLAVVLASGSTFAVDSIVILRSLKRGGDPDGELRWAAAVDELEQCVQVDSRVVPQAE
jgi:hypothetical protein